MQLSLFRSSSLSVSLAFADTSKTCPSSESARTVRFRCCPSVAGSAAVEGLQHLEDQRDQGIFCQMFAESWFHAG